MSKNVNPARLPVTRSNERDSYILAQALFIAARTIEERDHPFKEVSNAHDMDRLLEAYFPGMRVLFEKQEEYRKAIMAGTPPKEAMALVYGAPIEFPKA